MADGGVVLPFPTQGRGAPPPGGGPDTGSSPATMPVANRGEQAAGLAHVAVAVHVLEEALPLLGIGIEAGRTVHGLLPRLAKLVPPGTVSSGVENAVLQKIMLKNRQNSMNVALMRGAGGPPPPPGASPGASPGGPPAAAAPPPMAA